MYSDSDNKRMYYKLSIYLDPTVLSSEIIEKYREKINIIRQDAYDIETGTMVYMDAGFDLFAPDEKLILGNSISNKINHGINCSMSFNDRPCAYYLYPRSSMGSKTPLRLSNSVGIIDSGYRGHIIGVVDNISNCNYNINSQDRLLQICGPNIMYPIIPEIVSCPSELGLTKRGDGGFGSTGR